MAHQLKKKFLAQEVISYFDDQISAEEAARIALGTSLTSSIESVEQSLASEVTAREAGDNALDTRITALEGQVGEDLQAAITQLEADIASEAAAREAGDSSLLSSLNQEITDRQNAVAGLQSQIDSIQGTENVLFEDNASVYADGTAAIEDPSNREGWYFKSAGGGDKVNWYYFDGSQVSVEAQQVANLYTVATVDSASTDTFSLSYYTVPLMDGQDSAPWYRSRVVYVPTEPFARGVKTLFYTGSAPAETLYPGMPRVAMRIANGVTVGPQAPTELLLTTAFSTNSTAASGEIELLVNKLGIKSSTFNAEFSLEIRGDFSLSGVKESLLGEVVARQNADAQLQTNIDVEKARIDAILSASTADKDSFAEIVSLINSVDTENDQAFATYVLSNDAALAAEVSARQAGDSALESSITSLEGVVQVNFDLQQTDIDLLRTDVSANETAISNEAIAREAADTQVLTDAQNYTDAAIAAIPEVDLSGYYTKTEVDGLISSESSARQSADSALNSRLSVVEAKGFAKGSALIGAELGFVDLDREYATLLFVSVGRLAVHEGEDYTVSVVNGVTRITWIGSLLNPTGVEAIETGDKVFWAGSF